MDRKFFFQCSFFWEKNKKHKQKETKRKKKQKGWYTNTKGKHKKANIKKDTLKYFYKPTVLSSKKVESKLVK